MNYQGLHSATRAEIPATQRRGSYSVVMSCIRFNTTAMKSQLDEARIAGLGNDPVASFLSPEITESKVKRIVTMSEDPNPKIRESAALSYHAPLSVYEKLAKDPDEGVRSCLARNQTTPCDVLRTLAKDSSETVRAFVAINYYVPEDAMEELAKDTSPTVQKLVAWKASLKEDTELVSA
jgi:hypothetical protein